MKRLIQLTACLLLLFISCKKDPPPEKPLVFVSPSAAHIYAKVDDVILFNINAQSDIAINRFYITSKADNGFQQTELDTAINIKNFTTSYQYQVPSAVAGKSVIFTFTAVDAEGNSGLTLRRVYVEADSSITLVETSGHTLYSHANTISNPDAYNLETNSPKQSSLADSADMDILDNTNDTSSTLSLQWISPAAGSFVRFNGFDYANATDVTAKNAYLSGTKLDLIGNLQVNDILITKLGNAAAETYVVIKITTIIDTAGKDSDLYIFNVKKTP